MECLIFLATLAGGLIFTTGWFWVLFWVTEERGGSNEHDQRGARD